MTSCIVGKKIRAMGPGPLELFSFVVLAILMGVLVSICSLRGLVSHFLIELSAHYSLVIGYYGFMFLFIY